MESSLFSEGKEYISASRAAKEVGYASDYIGQLCRSDKVPGRLIGRTWYVDLKSLIEHKQSYKPRGVRKLTTDNKQSTTDTLPKSFKDIEVSYEPDIAPKLPELSKKISRVAFSYGEFIKETAALSLGLIVMVGIGSSMIAEVKPAWATLRGDQARPLGPAFS